MLLSSTAISALNPNGVDRKVVPIAFPGTLTPGTYYVGVIADHTAQVAESNEANNASYLIGVMLGNDAANTINGDPGHNTIFGLGGNDIIDGWYGIDTIAGGTGADRFVVDVDAYYQTVSTGWYDWITDFDQSGGTFNSAEGDRVDLSQLLWSTYGNVATNTIVKAFASGTGAIVKLLGGEGWQTVARLDGVHAGDTISVRISDYQPGGTPIVVQRPDPHSFDGDARGDLLWQHDSGMTGVWLMNGTTVTSAGGALPYTAPGWRARASADFDGDGKADILWQHDNGMPAVWMMNGTSAATVSGGSLPNPGASWHVRDAADFNGDGKADILWDNDNGTAGVWLMNGDSVSTGGSLSTSSGWHAKAAADFDGDGRADILWQHDNGTPAVWLMNGVSALTLGNPLPNPGASWHVKDAADFNGDGKADILWQHDDGTPAVWLMDGTSVLSAGGALTNPGASWHVKSAAD